MSTMWTFRSVKSLRLRRFGVDFKLKTAYFATIHYVDYGNEAFAFERPIPPAR